MTAQPHGDIDIEALRKSLRRPLDAFLFVSIVFLFLAVAAVFAVVVAVWKQPREAALQDRSDSFQAAYKVSNRCRKPGSFPFLLPRLTLNMLSSFSFLTDGELCISGSKFK